jgi:uncharacterized protein (TIGR03382 family)
MLPPPGGAAAIALLSAYAWSGQRRRFIPGPR